MGFASSSGPDFGRPGGSRYLAAIVCACVAAVSTGAAPPPPPPDYASPAAWAAWPGRASAADDVPPGLTEVPVAARGADVFFVHPTTYLTTSVGNAPYDEAGATRARLEQGVLRFQASAFNGCCRIFAPRYRQASLGAFLRAKEPALVTPAYELAYGDVLRAFDYYIAHENRGRPLLLASHSQGSLHALRLLQERIAGRALLRQLVAAYIVGYYVPGDIERTGVPVCNGPKTTGCLLDWNSVAPGSGDGARRASRLIWLESRYQPLGDRPAACVNPLNWVRGGEAAASLNLGALPPVLPAEALRAPLPALTGARCDGGLLRVSLPWSESHGFRNVLTFFGSYHVFDYNLFYSNVRDNASERVAAFGSAPAAAAAP